MMVILAKCVNIYVAHFAGFRRPFDNMIYIKWALESTNFIFDGKILGESLHLMHNMDTFKNDNGNDNPRDLWPLRY